MGALIGTGTLVAALLAGTFVWRRYRDTSRALAAMLSMVAAILTFGVIQAATPLGQAFLIRVSDDYAWGAIERSLEKGGIDLKPLFEADAKIREEFRREAIALSRRHWNDPEAMSRGAEQFGQTIYRKYVGQKAPNGSEASVLEWGRAYLALLEKVAGLSKQDCGAFAVGRTGGVGGMMPQIRHETNRLIAAAASAYTTSDPRYRVPSESEMEPIWQELFLGAGTPFSQDDLEAFDKIMTLPPPRACDLTVAFMKRLFTLPSPQQVMALRSLLHEFARG